MKRLGKAVLLLGTVFWLLNICGCDQKNNDQVRIKNYKDIVIGSRNYASSVAGSYVLKQALLSQGYMAKVEIHEEETLWDNLEDNQVNIVNSMWFYDVDYSDYKEIQDDVVDLGSNSAYYHRGLIVPSFVKAADIDEVKFYKYEFENIIYCLDESDYLFELVREANEVYGLNFKLQKVSAKDLDAILEDAFEKEKQIVIAGYSPHYLLDKYALRFLVDVKDIFGTKQEIHTIVNTEFIVRNKELKDFIDSFYLYEHEMNNLLNTIESNGGEPIADVVERWMKNHPNIIKRCNEKGINES